MQFVPVRDLRIRPKSVWKKLKRDKRLMITSNGRPLAMLKDIEGHDIEDELKIEAMARGIAAASKMREHARQKGLDKMPFEAIEEEIKAVRKER